MALLILFIGIFGYIFLSPDGEEYEIYENEIAKFSKNESETLVFYNNIDTESKASLLNELDKIIIPKWEENIEIINKTNTIENLSIDFLEQNKILLKYYKLRLKTYDF
ncbi:MAG: hypothetical protein QNK89_06645 [Lacinutrix sp.]|uniref:hypothetical protein n=1 Tax=Lacinutrix sp. TaxID=1937692 RepID=UPI0030B3C60C